MKFFLLLLISLPAFADVNSCKQFVDSVLKPAVTLDEAADDHGYRFEKDEEKALNYIRSYNVEKLQIPEEMKLAEREMNDCKFLMDPKKNDNYCGSLFENFNYLRGLIYATKNYKWNANTVQLAHNNVNAFLKESTLPGVPLIYLALSYSLFEELNPDKDIKKEKAELDKTIARLQAEAKKNPARECPGIQKAMKTERKEAEKIRTKFAALIKENKK